MTSTDPKTWLITGAGRGMGVDFARAALAAGHNVVATGRNRDTVRSAVGEHERLLVTELDITDARSAERAVAMALERFDRIDVLVNNAGNFFGGFFEELSPQQVRACSSIRVVQELALPTGWPRGSVRGGVVVPPAA